MPFFKVALPVEKLAAHQREVLSALISAVTVDRPLVLITSSYHLVFSAVFISSRVMYTNPPFLADISHGQLELVHR